MSTFAGTIDEFPGISIDQFEEINLDSSVYFLSHAHTDHTHGLSDFYFLDRLQTENLKLYSHEVTMTYLRQKFPYHAKCFQYLPLNLPINLKTADGLQFSVTLLPAGHCPGSVMFLFESDDHRVLYTGDFRLNLAEFKKFKGIYTSQRVLKRIDKVHLDTTFMLKCYEQFPNRELSLDAICNLISEWLEQNAKHRVHLLTPYYYGAEFIIMKIYERFAMPVHVNTHSYEKFYRHYPNMDKCITLNEKSRIHHHCRGFKDYCSSNRSIVRTINITATCWMNWRKNQEIWKATSNINEFRVCYSIHASLEEIRDILKFLKPRQVEANVEPSEYCNMEEMRDLIEECIRGNSPLKRSPTKRLEIEATSEGEVSAEEIVDGALERAERNPRVPKRSVLSDDEEEDEEYKKLKALKMEVSKVDKQKRSAAVRHLKFDPSVF